jgi:hypothetical protein
VNLTLPLIKTSRTHHRRTFYTQHTAPYQRNDMNIFRNEKYGGGEREKKMYSTQKIVFLFSYLNKDSTFMTLYTWKSPSYFHSLLAIFFSSSFFFHCHPWMEDEVGVCGVVYRKAHS